MLRIKVASEKYEDMINRYEKGEFINV
jgi:hypothetical protein